MFIVKRCVQDYEDVFKWDAAEFDTEQEADAYADNQHTSNQNSVWYEVHEVV